MGCLVPERSRGSGRLLWKSGDDGEVTTSCTYASLMTTSGGTKLEEVALNRGKEVDAVGGGDETPAMLFDAVFVFFFFFSRLSDAVSDGG